MAEIKVIPTLAEMAEIYRLFREGGASAALQALNRRWIAFANTGFAGSFDPFIAADYIGHAGAATMDRAELERAERRFCAAFPDAHHTIDDLIAEGDRVVLRTTARATHQGEFEGISGEVRTTAHAPSGLHAS